MMLGTGTRGWKARSVIETWKLDGGGVTTIETQSCRHCQAVLVLLERDLPKCPGAKKAEGFCTNCNSVLCGSCAKKTINAPSAKEACRPFTEVVEESLRKQALRRACGL
jgi:hypothetical protein